MPIKAKNTKASSPKTPSKATPPALQAINPLRITTCPPLSRKSQLSYELGQDAAKAFHYRIVSCDGGGFFSPEWIAWTDWTSPR